MLAKDIPNLPPVAPILKLIHFIILGGITELSRPSFSKTGSSLSIKLGFKNTDLG